MNPDLAVGIALFIIGMTTSALLIYRDLRHQSRRRNEGDA